MSLLKGKTALITGASRGIGKSIAFKFAQEGANIAFTDLFYDEVAQNAETSLNSLGIKAKGYGSDASKFEPTQDIVKKIVAEFGTIDILVNNAGITKDVAFKRMTEEQWDIVLTINLKSVFNFIKAVQPIMWKQGSGSIINMSSVVGVTGNANQVNYSASKAGMLGVTKSIAKEVGVRNIRCNAIAPGFIETNMTHVLPDNVREEWMKAIPLRRGGSSEDVANVALFLASDLSSYVTGQTINVCGGMVTS